MGRHFEDGTNTYKSGVHTRSGANPPATGLYPKTQKSPAIHAAIGIGKKIAAMQKNNPVSKILALCFNENIDFRVQIFNTLGFLGFVLGLVFGVFSIFVHPEPLNMIANFGSSVIASAVIWRANTTGNFKRYFLLTVIVVFIMIFPVLFFVGGGYMSGMPSFFVFAVAFTILMLEGRQRAVFTVLEITLYLGCFLIAYFIPETVVPFPTETDMAMDIIFGSLVAAAALAVAIYRHIVVYDKKQKELEKANDALRELDSMKTKFYQDMHHEMKTPLNVINTDIQNADDMLNFDINKATIQSKLESAQQEIIRLARMIENSIDVAAAQVKSHSMEPFDFGLLLRTKAGMFSSLLQQSGNRLTIQIPDDLPKIIGNADMLSQVIFNLMYNAHKHTQNGEITVSAENKGDCLEIEIRDSGEGIAPDLLPRVFKRGVSSDGTGYGLSICKTIMEMHGGSIGIESELGKGTVVTFTLPAASEV